MTTSSNGSTENQWMTSEGLADMNNHQQTHIRRPRRWDYQLGQGISLMLDDLSSIQETHNVEANNGLHKLFSDFYMHSPLCSDLQTPKLSHIIMKEKNLK